MKTLESYQSISPIRKAMVVAAAAAAVVGLSGEAAAAAQPTKHKVVALSGHKKHNGNKRHASRNESAQPVQDLCSIAAIGTLASQDLAVPAADIRCQPLKPASTSTAPLPPACYKAVWYDGTQDLKNSATPRVEVCIEPRQKKTTDDWGPAGRDLWKYDVTAASKDGSHEKLIRNAVNGRAAIVEYTNENTTDTGGIDVVTGGAETLDASGKWLAYDVILFPSNTPESVAEPAALETLSQVEDSAFAHK